MLINWDILKKSISNTLNLEEKLLLELQRYATAYRAESHYRALTSLQSNEAGPTPLFSIQNSQKVHFSRKKINLFAP